MPRGHLRIWVSPTHLRAASQKAAALLKNSEFEVLYLNLQRDLEGLVEALADGAPYEWFIDRLQELRLLREPISSWEYGVKPILLAVRGLRQKSPDLKIWCYKQPGFAKFSAELAVKIARLVLRLSSTGKTDLREWRRLLMDFVEASDEALEDEARYITQRLDRRAFSTCISDFCGRDLMDRLKRTGFDVSLSYIFLPYHFTPLEILLREFRRKHCKGSTVSDHRLLELVKSHAEFIREYVITSEDYDAAYFRWVHDKAKWLRFGPRIHVYRNIVEQN